MPYTDHAAAVYALGALPHQEGFPCKKGSPSFRVRSEGGPRTVQRYVFSAIYAFDVVMRISVLRHLFGWSAEVAMRALYPTMAGDQMCFPVSRWAGLVYRIDMCPVRPTEIAALAFMVKLVSFAWCSIVRCCNPLDTTSLLEGRGVIDLRGRYGVSERLRLGRPAGRGSVHGLEKSWGAGTVAGCGGGNLW